MIGVFDSGIGGLSVWREVLALLPSESTMYFADSAHCPYGPRSINEIQKLALEISNFLIQKKCSILVVACNTITAAAAEILRQSIAVPIVAMEPAIKPAALASQTGHVGVLATEGTLKAERYRALQQRTASQVEVHVQAGVGLVELIEAGKENSEETIELLKRYLLPMQQKNIDQLVLGCTHYPFLQSLMLEILGPKVHIHDPAPAVARRVKQLMQENNLLNQQDNQVVHTFYSSGSRVILDTWLQRLGASLSYVEIETLYSKRIWTPNSDSRRSRDSELDQKNWT